MQKKPGLSIRLALHGVLALWAGFWLWFSVASSFGEPGGLGHLLMPALPIVICLVMLWKRSRLGGIALILFAIGSAALFQGRVAWALLSAPALVLGLAFAIWNPAKT